MLNEERDQICIIRVNLSIALIILLRHKDRQIVYFYTFSLETQVIDKLTRIIQKLFSYISPFS